MLYNRKFRQIVAWLIYVFSLQRTASEKREIKPSWRELSKRTETDTDEDDISNEIMDLLMDDILSANNV